MPHVYTHSMYFSHIIIYISLHNMYLYVSMHLSDEACARAMMQSNAGKQNFAEARGKRGGGQWRLLAPCVRGVEGTVVDRYCCLESHNTTLVK